MESNPEVIAFSPITPSLEGTAMLQDIQNQRGAGSSVTTSLMEKNISQGIGRREGIAYGEQRVFVPPTTVYQQDQVVREIDGIKLELTRVPGETEDQIMIWLPEKKSSLLRRYLLRLFSKSLRHSGRTVPRSGSVAS